MQLSVKIASENNLFQRYRKAIIILKFLYIYWKPSSKSLVVLASYIYQVYTPQKKERKKENK